MGKRPIVRVNPLELANGIVCSKCFDIFLVVLTGTHRETRGTEKGRK